MDGDIDTFDWQSPGKQTNFIVEIFVANHPFYCATNTVVADFRDNLIWHIIISKS